MIEEMILPDGCSIGYGSLTTQLIPDSDQFDKIWKLHPIDHSQIVIHGKKVSVPRWDQAFEKDYPFSNAVAEASPCPDILRPYLQWCQVNVNPQLNGLFVNWHDGAKSHYHGKHRDSVKGLISETPIVTISLGEERVFRVRPYPDGKPPKDFVLNNGDFVVIPWETNRRWTHEIPKFTRYQGLRISVTLRAFE